MLSNYQNILKIVYCSVVLQCPPHTSKIIHHTLCEIKTLRTLNLGKRAIKVV